MRLNRGAGKLGKLVSGWNPKPTKIWKLMKIWKIDVWNKITYKKWNICNLLYLFADQREKSSKMLIPWKKNVFANWGVCWLYSQLFV